MLHEASNWQTFLDCLIEPGETKQVSKPTTYTKTIAYINKTTEKISDKPGFLYLLCLAVEGLSVKLRLVNKKKQLAIDELSVRGKEVYKEILYQCTDDRVLHIMEISQQHQLKWSGRTIDTLVTRFHLSNNCSYYLDITDGYPCHLVDTHNIPDRMVILFDVGDAYMHKMNQYSKNYFDCFARGDEVLHPLKNGQVIPISLCQFMFFYWADAFKVLEFLSLQHDTVVSMRKKHQQLKDANKSHNRKIRKTSIFEGSSIAVLTNLQPFIPPQGNFVHAKPS